MFGNRLSEVVKHLLIINVLMFVGVWSIMGDGGYNLALFYPTSQTDFFKPYQLVTHMFMHGNTSHLFFNMFGLFIFGPMVEYKIGKKSFFQLYFLAGFGALILHLGVKYLELNYFGGDPRTMGIPMLGASGAITGVVAAFATLFPNLRVQLLIPPIPMKAKHMALLFIGLDLYLGASGRDTGVAHFAHVGGAIIGFIFIRFMGRDNYRIN